MIIKSIQILLMMLAQHLHRLPLGEGITALKANATTMLGGAFQSNDVYADCELYPEVNNSNNRKANNFGDDNEEGTALMQKNKQKSIVELSNSISISPNPADEILTIKMPTGINSIEIVSIEGKLIRTINVTNTGLNIDVSNLDNGLYTFIFKSSSITPIAKKVTIIH
jgi:hypothetical protein